MRELQPTLWTIEQPVPDEAPSIAAVMARDWRTYQREGQPERNAKVQADADAYLLPERIAKRRKIIEELGDEEYMRVAKVDSDIVGWLYGYTEPEKQELLALYVDEAFHGEGVAHDMVRGFFGWPTKIGLSKWGWLTTTSVRRGFMPRWVWRSQGNQTIQRLPYRTNISTSSGKRIRFCPQERSMMAEAITIQNVSADDIPQLLEMHAQSWRDTYPNKAAGVGDQWVRERTAKWLTPENIEKRRQDAAEVAADPDMLWKVAKDENGAILGLVRASRKEGTQYFGALYVDKKYHGKGVAQALMDAYLQWEDLKMPTTLDVASYNDRAKAFYRKYGFKEVEGTERLHHDVMPIVTMVRNGGDND